MIPRLDLGLPPSQQHVTTDEAAALIHVPAGTVRQWASRGRITATGKAHGRPVYLLAEVLAYWSATRRSAA